MPQRPTRSPSLAQIQRGLGYVPSATPVDGTGVSVEGGRNNPTLDADTQAILDAISSTQGVILYRGASAWAALSPDNGKFLKSNGAAANPSWATPTDTGITQLTGDVTAGPGSGSQAATLAASGVSAATYGDSTHVAQVALDAKGRATGASNVAIAFPAPAVPSVTFGTGVPGGTPADGALYFDDTGSPYVGYVGRSGSWHQF